MLSGVTLGPIETISGVGACFATLDDEERAIAVMLDLMDPARTWRWMIDCGGKLRLDELKRHAKTITRGLGNCESKSLRRTGVDGLPDAEGPLRPITKLLDRGWTRSIKSLKI